jgi:hypothetical protein
VYGGSAVSNTLIGGTLHVFSGGMAERTVVSSGGFYLFTGDNVPCGTRMTVRQQAIGTGNG